MPEKNIYDLLIAILPSSLVLIGTVLGVLMSNGANNKRLLIDTEQKQKIETSKVRREKLEDLFTSCHKLLYLLKDFHWLYIDYFGGAYTRQELNDRIVTGMEDRRQLFTKVDMIVGIYFQSLSEKWKEIESDRKLMEVFVKSAFIEKTRDRELQDKYKAEVARLEYHEEEFLKAISELGRMQGLTSSST